MRQRYRDRSDRPRKFFEFSDTFLIIIEFYRNAGVKLTDESKINRTHKNICGFMLSGKYEIAFNEYIYNDCRDGIELEKIVQCALKPEIYDSSGSWCGMSGFFIKDNIRVDTYWNDMLDYLWQIDTDDEAVQKKVYEWACEVYDEYLRQHRTKND